VNGCGIRRTDPSSRLATATISSRCPSYTWHDVLAYADCCGAKHSLGVVVFAERPTSVASAAAGMASSASSPVMATLANLRGTSIWPCT
jgi:hypothetical protein